jgi:hypothetical protein
MDNDGVSKRTGPESRNLLVGASSQARNAASALGSLGRMYLRA